MIKTHLHSLFHFGTSAIYFDSTGKTKESRIFIDTGWREPIPGYDSHPAEAITIVSILLEDVPIPRISDQIQVDDSLYKIICVQAQDDVVAALHVRKL